MARAEAEASEQRFAFLAQASEILSSSLDYEATLKSVARLAVPLFADWCRVDVLKEGGEIQRVTVAHQDPAKAALAEEIGNRYPPDPNDPRGLPNVLRTGEAAIYSQITDAMLVKGARDAEHLELLRKVGMRSVMIVPLVARERTLGALTLVSAE
jgi:GAF domain-containing protein